MSDLFGDKAKDWDARELVVELSAAVGAAMLERVAFTPEMSVMDFGAGTGLVAAHIAPRVANVTAVDTSKAMLEQLLAKPELKGSVRAVCQDILEEPLKERFDVIVSAMAAHHVPSTAGLMRRFFEHLRPGGRLALADLDAEDGTFHPEGAEGVHHSGFERDALARIATDAGFTDVAFTTAHVVHKPDGAYPIFLLTARRSDDRRTAS